MNTSIKLKLFTPHKKQKEVLRDLDGNTYNRIVVVAGRQSGKSILGLNYILKFSCSNPDTISMVVSPTEKQAIKLYKQIIKAAYHKSIISSHKAGKGDCEIVFSNGSSILFRSCKSGDSLRGHTINGVLWLDEFRDFNKETVESVLVPMLNAGGKKKKILVTSTPAGKSNILYEWYQRGLSNESQFAKWKSFHFTCFDSPYIDPDDLENERLVTPELIWQQEYLGEFIDAGCLFENLSDALILEEQGGPIQGDYYYAGIDVGFSDATVVSIINNGGHLVKYYRFTGIETPKLMEHIVSINEKWKFKKILIEVNGVGLPMYHGLKQKLNNIDDFNTTSKNKPEMINHLIHLFRMKYLKLVNTDELRNELESFIGTPKGSYMKFEARSGSHDDLVMSLAIARQCYEMYRYDSRYLGFY